MYIARWHMTANPGKTDACIALFRKWEMDVGDRVGWKPGTMLVSAGFLGSNEGEIEIEVKVDSLSDLESIWKDVDSVPHHKVLMAELAPLLLTSSRWTVRQVFARTPND